MFYVWSGLIAIFEFLNETKETQIYHSNLGGYEKGFSFILKLAQMFEKP